MSNAAPAKIAQWERQRESTLAAMQEVMGPLPDESRRVPLDIRVLSEESQPHFSRRLIEFSTEPNDRIQAYLLMPHNLSQPAAAMLCLHQTTPLQKDEPAGVGGLPNLHYAAHLAARGYVTLAPDYSLGRNFARPDGDQYDPYANGYVSATMKGIWNHMRAVDLLQSLPEVDGARIGCIGHSLGGHNTIFLAAFDERISVAVSSCGFNSFLKYHGGDLTDWSHSGYMPRIAERFACDARQMPFDFPAVLAALAPRAVFVNAPLRDDFEVSGVKDCLVVARKAYALFAADEKLKVVYPACGHDFPAQARESAYAFVDKWLGESGMY